MSDRIHFGQIAPPKKTFFYKRKDGSIFACEGKEADMIHGKYEQVGVSDGTTFYDVLSRGYKALQAEYRELDALYAAKGIPFGEYDRKIEEIGAKMNALGREAFEAEKAVAMGKREKPADTSVVVMEGSKQMVEQRMKNMGF